MTKQNFCLDRTGTTGEVKTEIPLDWKAFEPECLTLNKIIKLIKANYLFFEFFFINFD